MDDFEQGSIAAANAIFGWLTRNGHWAAYDGALKAWNDGTITDPPPIEIKPKMGKDEARGRGYTGDKCVACNSMKMKVDGHCQVCEDCGQTTGCS